MSNVKKMKKDLIDSLNEKQRLSMITLLSIYYRPQRPVTTSSEYLKSCEVPTFFGFLHKLIFNEWFYEDHASALKVVQNISKIKETLKGVPITITFKESGDSFSVPPRIPKDFTIDNETLANVWVTEHAWKRFWERFFPKELNSEKVAEAIKKSFFQAKIVTLTRGHGVLRIIRNRFHEAQYFFNALDNCRFVVIFREDKHLLITVEIPK
ncbi:MAG: hypothetical protein FJZ43_03460 [Candidatus Staskawiczbacteria bacterium]|nr:hypothetical protein [Candidatus Staskawiczbacteria bacterium]